MNNGKVDWEGNFVAVVTPFSESGEIDEAAFRDNIALLLDEGAEGIIVSGCTGEAWALSPEERLRLFELGVDTAAGAVPVVAGTGGIATQDVIALSERARDVGCQGVMVLPPYYCRPGDAELLAHYTAISDAARIPTLLYNIPKRTGVDLTPDLLQRLVQVEHVVAIKESGDRFTRVETLVQRFGDQIQVFTGHSAERGVAAVVTGASGWVSSLESQIMGREAVQMYDVVKDGDIKGAMKLQSRTLALDQGARSIGTFPANLKAAMNLLGRPGGYPRSPLLPLAEAQTTRLAKLLEGLGLPVAAATAGTPTPGI